jgi:hypothetical protein
MHLDDAICLRRTCGSELPTDEDLQSREDCLLMTLKQSDASRSPSTIAELTELANDVTDRCSTLVWQKMDSSNRLLDRMRTQRHALFIAQQFKVERQIRTTGTSN